MEKESSGGRLQSLKLPRDLSLGLQKTKKQYAPNLNVVRNKDKTKELIKKMDQKRKEKTNRQKNEKSDHKQRFLQSAGVFSQGSGEIKRNSNQNLERRVNYRDNSLMSDRVLPTINKNNSWNANKKEAVMDDINNCDIDSDEEKLSLRPLTLEKVDSKDGKTVVKKESLEKLGVIPEPFNDDYSEDNPALCLVKLPDSFAGKGLSDDPNIKKLFDYPLSGMLEGQIGKLIIRKSGKIQAQIGKITYELNPENTFESKEELAAIIQGDNSKSCITILGDVLNNFVMYPDYDSIINKK